MTKLALRSVFGTLLLASTAFALASCTSPMLKSVDLDDTARCDAHSVFAYALPKHLLKLNVVEVDAERDRFDITIGEPLAVEERGTLNCINYLGSVFAEDQVDIKRENGTLLLATVTGNAADKSKDIALTVIEGVAEGAAGLSAQRAGVDKADPLTVLKDVMFDPFSRRDMERVNGQLERFGYCIFLMSHGDPFVPDWTPTTCGLAADTDTNKVQVQDVSQPPGSGIRYRPLLPHRLVVMRKEDPDVGKFELFKMQSFEMANAAPTFTVDVSRTYFAERKTMLTFKDGTLTNITLDKDSELAAMVQIPLNIVKAGLSIPARALVISTNEANNRAALINAQAKLIETYRALEDKKGQLEKAQTAKTGVKDTATTAGSPFKSSSLVVEQRKDQCLAAYEPEMTEEIAACEKFSEQGL